MKPHVFCFRRQRRNSAGDEISSILEHEGCSPRSTNSDMLVPEMDLARMEVSGMTAEELDETPRLEVSDR